MHPPHLLSFFDISTINSLPFFENRGNLEAHSCCSIKSSSAFSAPRRQWSCHELITADSMDQGIHQFFNLRLNLTSFQYRHLVLISCGYIQKKYNSNSKFKTRRICCCKRNSRNFVAQLFFVFVFFLILLLPFVERVFKESI